MRERKLSLEVGDKVTVSGYVSKDVEDNHVVHPRHQYPQPREGVIAGVRLLPEGRIVYGHHDSDEPSYLKHTTSMAVYLVAISRRSLIYAAPDQVTLAE